LLGGAGFGDQHLRGSQGRIRDHAAARLLAEGAPESRIVEREICLMH